MDINKIIAIVRKNIKEQVVAGEPPTNNASSGNIGGLPPDHPPVDKRKRKRPPVLARGRMVGARTRFKHGWTPNKNAKS